MSVYAALVVAAGRGERMKGSVPKQYRRLGQLTVLRHTIHQLQRHQAIGTVQCVIHPDDHDLYAEATAGLDLPEPVLGGAQRQESVWRGLEALAERRPDHVLIHDGVRPFVDAKTIDNVIAGLATAEAVVPAVEIADTIKRVGANRVIAGTVDRTHLWGAQTPQGFRFATILAAHRQLREQGSERLVVTDDAQMMELLGVEVLAVEGNPDNFKISRAFDLDRAQRVLQAGRLVTRIGLGHGTHPFGPGDHVMICGVAIAHRRGTAGKDDVDVPLNAVADALLGTAGGFGEDGQVDPDRPSGCCGSSALRLREALSIVANKGGRIVNVDITVLCEEPKILPYREVIQTRMTSLLSVAPDCFSIKATTMEGLGFVGRREGLGAQALATVEYPAS